MALETKYMVYSMGSDRAAKLRFFETVEPELRKRVSSLHAGYRFKDDEAVIIVKFKNGPTVRFLESQLGDDELHGKLWLISGMTMGSGDTFFDYSYGQWEQR
jgi:hypothetical protein